MKPIRAEDVATQSLEWGAIKWFVSPGTVPGAGLSFGEVVLLPGMGHDRHNHAQSEEILYILAGEGLQVLDDGEPFPVKAGDTIYVPTAVYHSTKNTGWTPMHLLAVYNPAGPEKDMESLPDYKPLPAGEAPHWSRG